jgi:hypothetical protein
VDVDDSLRPNQHQSCCWRWTLWCRASAEPSRGGCPPENGRRGVHVRISGRSRRSGSRWGRRRCGCRWSRCSRCSRCRVRPGRCPNRGHGWCAGGCAASHRCSHPRWRSHPGRASVSRRCPDSRRRPAARGRSGRRSADCAGWTARRPNRGHGRCCRGQRRPDGLGADRRPSARRAGDAWSRRLRHKEKPSELGSEGFSLCQDENSWATYSLTTTGSPMLAVLKYHSASAGLRLMHPWLTFSRPSDWTAHGAECTNSPRLLIRVAYSTVVL